MKLVLVLLLGLASAGDPSVFQEYFDDQLRFVDISQEKALSACLPNGTKTPEKIALAYASCFGSDYSFEDLADSEGRRDSDADDLPDVYEANEACFYRAMGWVAGEEVDKEVVKADMAGLKGAELFGEQVDSCASWSGTFGGRRKRSATEEEEEAEEELMEEEEEEEVREEVPEVVEKRGSSMGLLRTLVRKARGADPAGGEQNNGGNGNGGKGKKGGKKSKSARVHGKGGKGNKKGKSKGKGNVRKGNSKGKSKGKGKGKGKGKARNGKEKGVNKGKGKGKGKGKTARADKKAAKKDEREEAREEKKARRQEARQNGKGQNGGKMNKTEKLSEETYNKLWCFDLAMEQALEKCVEDKLQN